jgi:hypothetical protein
MLRIHPRLTCCITAATCCALAFIPAANAGDCEEVSSHTRADFGGDAYNAQLGFSESEIIAAQYTLDPADFPIEIRSTETIFLTTPNCGVLTTTQWSILVWDGPPNTGILVYEESSLDGILPPIQLGPGLDGTNVQVSIDPDDPEQIVIYNDSGTNTFTIGYRIDEHNSQTQNPCFIAPPESANAFPTTDLDGVESTTGNWIYALDCGAFGCPAGWRRFSQFAPCTPSGDWVMRATWEPVNCVPPTGACCLPDGSCQIELVDDCNALGGSFQGDQSICQQVNCPQPPGACCFDTGGCLDLTPANCTAAGGFFQGAGTLCATTECFPEGACCLPDGSCVDGQSPDDCALAGGVYQGSNSTCDDVECPLPTGSCCFATGFCLELTLAECDQAGANWGGAFTTCDTPVIIDIGGDPTACDGDALELTASACGTDPLNYLWFKDSDPLPDQTDATLSIAPLTSADAGIYELRVGVGTTYTFSDPIDVTVTIAGDANCDGIVSAADIDPFVIALTGGEAQWSQEWSCDFLCANDLNHDGSVSAADIDPFVSALIGQP